MTYWRLLLTAGAVALATVAQAGNRATLLEQITTDPQLSTLAAALAAADLNETLEQDGPFTIYAPDNDAFAALPEGTLNVLLLPENGNQLTDILLYHVDDRKLKTRQLIFGPAHYRPLLEDSRLCITRGDEITIADGTGQIATVSNPDIKAQNGVIHIIDKVLLPGEKPKCHM